MRGRKPLPTAIKQVTGNRGRRPIRQGGLQPQGKACKPTKLLSPEAAAEWDRLAPALQQLGILTPADQMFFVGYCEAAATYARANAKLKQQGELVLNADGLPVRNPWLRVRSDAAKEMHTFGSEFGLSPSVRARFVISEPNLRPDEFDELLRTEKYFTR